ncbi:type VI secretion system baseplate subunit TssG [Pantoea agglomerans]
MTDSGIRPQMDFFALLREVERSAPDAPRLGTLNDKAPARLRLKQRASLAFAPREVAEVQVKASGVSITMRHFGLLAPYGPLPLSVTEHARNEFLSHNSTAFSDFLSLLTQRHALLWYRAWSQLHPMVGSDRPDSQNRLKTRLLQIAGVPENAPGTNAHARLRENWPAAWLPGRAALRDLSKMLNHFFSVPVKLHAFAGRWIAPTEQKPANRLGKHAAVRLGKRIFDAQHMLLIEIGPLRYPAWQDWQRGTEKLLMLASMCQMFVRHQLHIQIDLLMKTASGQMHAGPHRLGRVSLLKPRDALIRQCVWQTPV